MPSDTGRLPGLLTSEQRKFLRDGPDDGLSDEAIRQRRYRIRKRVQSALLDFSLLDRHLDPDEWQQVFNPEQGHDDPKSFTGGVRDALGLLYLGMEGTLVGLAPVLRAGITNAVNKVSDRPRRVGVEFEVTISDPVRFEEIVKKLAAGKEEELTESELREFLHFYRHADEFDPEIALREREKIIDMLDDPDLEDVDEE